MTRSLARVLSWGLWRPAGHAPCVIQGSIPTPKLVIVERLFRMEIEIIMKKGYPDMAILRHKYPEYSSPSAVPTQPDLNAVMVTYLTNLHYAHRWTAMHWQFTKPAFGIVKRLKDKHGQYLWDASVRSEPSTVLGIPYQLLDEEGFVIHLVSSITCAICQGHNPQGVAFCIVCGAALAATGRTERL